MGFFPFFDKYLNVINRLGLFLILIICSLASVNGQQISSKDSIENKNKIVFIDIGNYEKPDSADYKSLKALVKNKPVYSLEKMPEFPGGEDSLHAFIMKNIKYSRLNQSIVRDGRVTIRMTITKSGSIKDIKIIRGLEPTYDKEAIRVISKMPKWIPGEQNGRKYPVYYTLPVDFRKRNNK